MTAAGEKEFRDPTPEELKSPLFNAIWNAIKGWDISRTSNGLYSGATGTDVCIIMDAIRGNGQPLDDYVAWCKYVHHPHGQTTIRTCDSSEEGAFRVYRRPDVYQNFCCLDCGFVAALTVENIEEHRVARKCKGTTLGIRL